MKQSLDFKLGQHLTITPQLQQAIRLLQLSSIELQAEVQDALESNMMLEMDDGDNEQKSSEQDHSHQSYRQSRLQRAGEPPYDAPGKRSGELLSRARVRPP